MAPPTDPLRGFRVLRAPAVAAAIAATPFAAMAERIVEVTPGTAVARIAAARPGDILTFAPGRYATLTVTADGTFADPLVLRAADPADPPVLAGLILRGADFVTLEAMAFAPKDGGRPDAIKIRGGGNIKITEARVDAFERGLVAQDTDGLFVADSSFSGQTGGAVHVVSTQDAVLADNSFEGPLTGADDGQALVTIAATTVAQEGASPIGLRILNNRLVTAPDGTQPGLSIARQADPDDPVQPIRDVDISGNVVLSAHPAGIAVGSVLGVTIERNSILRRVAPTDTRIDQIGPAIAIDPEARDVLVLANVAHRLPRSDWHPDWIVAGNFLTQARVADQDNHYARVFAGYDPSRPATVEDFAPRPGGLLDGREVGAPMLKALRDGLDDGEAVAIADGWTGVIRLDPHSHAVVADAGTGEAPLRHDIGGPVVTMGNALAPVMLSREMSRALFEAEAFSIDMRLHETAGYRGAGEVLRLHRSFEVSVTGRGRIEVVALTELGGAVRLRSPVTRLFRDGMIDLTITYDGPVGMLRILSNGELLAERPLSGRLRPEQKWGLAFGNPFGTHRSFSGMIDSFEIRARRQTTAEIVESTFRP